MIRHTACRISLVKDGVIGEIQTKREPLIKASKNFGWKNFGFAFETSVSHIIPMKVTSAATADRAAPHLLRVHLR